MFYYRHPAVVCVIHIGGHSVFPCSRCSRTFTSPSALVRHMRTHTGERDPGARQACIRHYGAVCKCCGFNFEKTYGEHGKGSIHVHHIRPLRTPGERGQPSVRG
ncbi:hypothetical protein ODY36_005104 [Salmonella enterica]|nr:hypothetical protein [Salmonella enterica]